MVVPYDYNEAKKSLLLSDVTDAVTSCHSVMHSWSVCGDAGVSKPTKLPVV